MLTVNTSISSLNAQRQLTTSTRAMGTSFERLSSGLRINGAKDDAAGLSIGTQMEAQTRGLQKSIQNSTDWISLLQTAEGGLEEMTNILQRVRELSVQSINETNNDRDRASLNAEVEQLIEEFDRIAHTTHFNGIHVLNGELQDSVMQLGANSGEDVRISLGKLDAENVGRGVFAGPNNGVDTSLGFNNLTFTVNGETYDIRDTVEVDDTLSTSLAENSAIAKAAAINSSTHVHGVEVIVQGTRLTTTGPIGAVDLDADSYLEVNGVEITGFSVVDHDANGALTSAINAVFEETGVYAKVNANGRLVLTAEDGRNIEFKVQNLGAAFAGQADNTGVVEGGRIKAFSRETFSFENNLVAGKGNDHALGGNSLNADVFIFQTNRNAVHNYDISSKINAERTLRVIEFAFEQINTARADMGAQQNRLESTISNLQTTHENLSAARSRIVDADFATETAELARAQIIQQAGVSVLSQANQSLSIALSLLG